MPVWGERYVRQFLEFGLPTLLAPGNLPALAETLPCEFEILTSLENESFIKQHPAYRKLAETCQTSIRLIDHLITARNYSTTITLAYAEAIRDLGASMVDTCFFFLVSDYIMANGSLMNVLNAVRSGSNAVLVGNFQVRAEEAMPWLTQQRERQGGRLELGSRQLMTWALKHLHPATVANIVNNPLSHNNHANRLFWRVDPNTLLGRFYLMHMIAIRPEVADFQIGASCDYSFVPEMCPSANISVITDSDDYLVIEMQPEGHESGFLRAGPLLPRQLARSLNEWATEQHRRNAHHSIVYHSDGLPKTLPNYISQADKFVEETQRYLSKKAKPFNGHHYWLGAIAAFREARGEKLSSEDYFWLHEMTSAPHRLIARARTLVFGKPPFVYPWHARWPDYRMVVETVKPILGATNLTLLNVSESHTPFTVQLASMGERVVRVETSMFLKATANRWQAWSRNFDTCLIELSEAELPIAKKLLKKVGPLVRANGEICLLVNARSPLSDTLRESVARHADGLVLSAWPVESIFVPTSRVRALAMRISARLGDIAHKHPFLGVPLLLLLFLPLTCMTLLGNIISAIGIRSGNKAASSVVMKLRVNGDEAADDSRTECAELSESLTREPQYARCLELQDAVGQTRLGLMTNQVWHDDPRRVGIVLARYKFVAKMLAGFRSVGEVGCGDAFGSRIVQQEVEELTAYDFDPLFIHDIESRQTEKWRHAAVVHDIMTAPLPRKHDAIYSLDVIEHINCMDEQRFMEHLCGSLSEAGVVIIGTPSLESQVHASPQSKAGHVNCKTASQLKSLLSKYFHSVFVFSMNDEVVHTGYYPMAHYLLAVCANKRNDVP